MLGSRKAPRRGWLVLLLGLSSCSGKEFTSSGASAGGSAAGGSDAGGSAPSGGSSTSAGSGGDASSAGAPDSGGSAGSGGTVATCDCPAGYYCRDGTVDCFDCKELNRLHFSTPERMSTLSNNGQGSRFPRIGSTATDLLYRSEAGGLRYTADASTSAGSNVKGTLDTDSGPLLLAGELTANGAATLMGFNFLFDRDMDGQRSLYIGQWNKGLTTVERAPAPYNGEANDYSIAVALPAAADAMARAFWMSDRPPATSPVLVTAQHAADAGVEPVTLNIDQETCPANDPDLAPWVTNDGKLLLVNHPHLNANCQPTAQGKDIYTALLQSNGQPTAPALPMNDVNSPMDDVEPSFSADMCDLYFASDRDGKFALYRAHRR